MAARTPSTSALLPSGASPAHTPRFQPARSRAATIPRRPADLRRRSSGSAEENGCRAGRRRGQPTGWGWLCSGFACGNSWAVLHLRAARWMRHATGFWCPVSPRAALSPVDVGTLRAQRRSDGGCGDTDLAASVSHSVVCKRCWGTPAVGTCRPSLPAGCWSGGQALALR